MTITAPLTSDRIAPITTDLWPEHTTRTPIDVVVAGVSLLELSRWCGSPCVHTAAAAIPGTDGQASPTLTWTVLTSTVQDVSCSDHLELELDADLVSCTALPAEAQLLGRASGSVRAEFRVHGTSVRLELPSDTHEGDLIAIPCHQNITLRDVRLSRDGSTSHCGR